jgi:hypothetical protein
MHNGLEMTMDANLGEYEHRTITVGAYLIQQVPPDRVKLLLGFSLGGMAFEYKERIVPKALFPKECENDPIVSVTLSVPIGEVIKIEKANISM